MHTAIDRLPQQQGDVMRGYYLQGRSLAALAADMETTEEEINRTRRKVRAALLVDKRLRALMLEKLLCYLHKVIDAFQWDWTSTVERAVMERDSQRLYG